MTRSLSVETERFALAEIFTISRGSKTQAEVVVCTIRDGAALGRGECVPYARYGETLDGVCAEIRDMSAAVADGIDRDGLLSVMKAGAARNALDCALWDLEAKRTNTPASRSLCTAEPHSVTTAYTLSLGSAEEMAAKARANAFRPLLKIKVGSADDVSRMRAVAEAAPDSRLIVDANEGWTGKTLRENLAAAAQCRVALVEQPLPAGKDEILRGIDHPVPVCADESVHVTSDLERLRGAYDAVNIKLDKSGGLTEALQLKRAAQEMGFAIMVGCMVGTSLAMAPAMLLAQDADFVDLDGPLLLARDRAPGLVYAKSSIAPPPVDLWG